MPLQALQLVDGCGKLKKARNVVEYGGDPEGIKSSYDAAVRALSAMSVDATAGKKASTYFS